ncbi:MAG: hypothetical protein P8170_04340 [Gemmatimonadota bacterium]
MNGSEPFRRVALVEGVYLAFAALAWWAIDPVRQTFLLPELFTTVARGALLLGIFVAGVTAWSYPRLGARAGDHDSLRDPPQ